MLRLILLSLISLTAACSSNPPREDWESCVKDDECVVYEGPCNSPKAIHKDGEDAYERHLDKIKDKVACITNKPAPYEFGAKCRNAKCALVPADKK